MIFSTFFRIFLSCVLDTSSWVFFAFLNMRIQPLQSMARSRPKMCIFSFSSTRKQNFDLIWRPSAFTSSHWIISLSLTGDYFMWILWMYSEESPLPSNLKM